MDSNKVDLPTTIMFFVIAGVGAWILMNYKRFADMTVESWEKITPLDKSTLKIIRIISQVFCIAFGLVFIGIGLYAGITSLLGR